MNSQGNSLYDLIAKIRHKNLQQELKILLHKWQ